MTTTDTPVNNGVNVQALLDARNALVDAPDAAQFTWKASTEWKGGTHSHSVVDEFFGLGGDQTHRTTMPITPRCSHPRTTVPPRSSSSS